MQTRADRRSLSFTDVARERAARTPDRIAFVFLENEREATHLTFSQLDAAARHLAGRLQSLARAGDRALLLYPPGANFVCALMACLYAGVVAVPAYPPRRNRPLQRIDGIVEDCAPSIALTDTHTLDALCQGNDRSAALRVKLIATDREPETPDGHWQPPELDARTLALLQYTSGSTGSPKGVMISHANILSNMEVMATAARLDDSAVFASWLPLFHDMGLFGKMLLPVYLGAQSVLMEPAAFVQKPLRWLQAITRYRATVCAAPDSAYELCARRITDEAKAQLDLSSLRMAFNGAEPVRASTLEVFSRAFESCGFRRQALRPVYGMAEATLFVSGQSVGSDACVKEFDAEALARNIASPGVPEKSQSLVSCGHAGVGHRICIVDPETGVLLPSHRIGEIWVCGPSVGTGYWNRPEESQWTFNARLPEDDTPYLRTGDLGFIHDRDLFVTGRLKDLIIVAGRNHYPQDLERTAEASDSRLLPNAAAAFSLEVDDEERVVLACEVRRESLRELDVEAIAAKVRHAIAEEHELDLHALVLLKPATMPRTSSGKVQRSRVLHAFRINAGLEIVGEWRKAARSQAAAAQSSTRDAQEIARWLTELVASLAGIPQQKLDVRAPFSSYGLSSRDAVALSGDLQEWLGRPLPPTLVYDFPSIEQLARHLSGAHTAVVDSRRSATGTGDIAIVGMGCRFPGARDPESFWRLLHEGRDAIAPANSRTAGLPPTGLLERIDEFDADFFGINAREAETLDPQQRLLLEVAWETFEHAGIAPGSLAGSNTAVMVGISNCDYIRLAQNESADVGPYVATGNALSITANRVSYTFDLRGPSWSVDTACSASLVAVHQACCALLRGECDAALAGGVNLILAPALSASFTQAGMLSPDGLCKTFDASANGYVRGEGAGLVFLKRLEDAVQDRDTVLAVIRGSAVNQDGRSNGLTAPNGPAQQAAIRSALHAAGVQPRDIGFVETHGTGTPLGDPIELNSLVAVLNEGRAAQETCFIGSVKPNIGHLESAAGIAGLIKTVLMLQHEEVPPHIHYRSLNPGIAIEGRPFRIPEHATRWIAPSGVRLAGVSSFGFGGTNAHVILMSPPQSERDALILSQTPCLVTLSARSAEGLRTLAASYRDFIDRHPETVLEELAFTTNVGRAHFPYRMAWVVANLDELSSKLTSFAAQAGREAATLSDAATTHAAELRPVAVADETSAPTPPAAGQQSTAAELAARYIQGESIDWLAFYQGRAPRRIALPTYPFERRRYWLSASEVSHPLLGRRLQQQAHLPQTWTWESRFDGPAAALFSGHRVMGSPVLPYSAYIEMALAAAAQVSANGGSQVSDLNLHAPLFLRDREHRTVHTVLNREAGGDLEFSVYQRTGAPDGDSPWRICASARIH